MASLVASKRTLYVHLAMASISRGPFPSRNYRRGRKEEEVAGPPVYGLGQSEPARGDARRVRRHREKDESDSSYRLRGSRSGHMRKQDRLKRKYAHLLINGGHTFRCETKACTDTFGDPTQLLEHMHKEEHFACRADGCMSHFATEKDRTKHERVEHKNKICILCLQAGVQLHKRDIFPFPHLSNHHSSCWACRAAVESDSGSVTESILGDSDVIDADVDADEEDDPAAADSAAPNPKSAPSKAADRRLQRFFADSHDLELHAITHHHAIHPAQLTVLYPAYVGTELPLAARYNKEEYAKFVAVTDEEEDRWLRHELLMRLLYSHDADLMVLATPRIPQETREMRLQRCMDLARRTGRVTHLPYLYALCDILFSNHNGNKNGIRGVYPGRFKQRFQPGIAKTAEDNGVSEVQTHLAALVEHSTDAKGTSSSETDTCPSTSRSGPPDPIRGRSLEEFSRAADTANQDQADPEDVRLVAAGSKVKRYQRQMLEAQWQQKHHPAADKIYEVPPRDFDATVQASLLVALEDATIQERKKEVKSTKDVAQPREDNKSSYEDGSNELYGPLADYHGHNICAMAVDSTTGAVLGIQFNQCHLQKSTAAHAEERLIDRLFATADLLGLDATVKYNKFLRHVIVYTSLQPCYQCVGKCIMAGVRAVIWLQDDPLIGVNVLEEVSKRDGKTWKTRGHLAGNIFPQMQRLNQSLSEDYDAFKSDATPFFVQLAEDSVDSAEEDSSERVLDVDNSTSVPTFLCTDAARDIYQREQSHFRAIASHPGVIASVPPKRRPAAKATSFKMVNAAGQSMRRVQTQAEAYLALSSIARYAGSFSYARGGFV